MGTESTVGICFSGGECDPDTFKNVDRGLYVALGREVYLEPSQIIWICLLKYLHRQRPAKRSDADAWRVGTRSHPQNEVMTIRPSSVPAFISLNTWLMSSSFIS